jgi:hypothetical protein
VDEWIADVRLTFANAMLFNPSDHLVHQMAKSLKTAFDKKLASVLEKLETRSFVNDGSGGTLGPAGDWPRKAKAILKSVMDHPQSFPFNEGVDWKKLKIPDYPKVRLSLQSCDRCTNISSRQKSRRLVVVECFSALSDYQEANGPGEGGATIEHEPVQLCR